MNKDQSNDTRVNKSTEGISPSEVGDCSWQQETHDEDQREVVLVLPLYDRVVSQITNIGNTRLATGLDEHPTEVSVPETFVSIVRIKVGVGVTMVSTVTSGPPLDRTLK